MTPTLPPLSPEELAELEEGQQQFTGPLDPLDGFTIWACGGDIPVMEFPVHVLRGEKQAAFDAMHVYRVLTLLPRLLAALRASDEDRERLEAVDRAVTLILARHDAHARACNFAACGCDVCLPLRDALAPR